MINPLEIQRGSILCHEGRVKKVKAVSELILFEGEKAWIGGSMVEGEPITEEWLKIFGFEKAIYTDGEEYMQLDKTDYSPSPYNLYKSWKCYRIRKNKDDWYFEVHKNNKGHLFSFQEK